MQIKSVVITRLRLHEALEIIRSDLRMERNLAKLEKKKKNELKAALGKKSKAEVIADCCENGVFSG